LVEQITGILKQAELGTPIAELCRQHGVSEQSFYRWKKVYGGMLPSEARELKQLREENTKLKRLVADLSLDKVMLQDVVQKSGALSDEPLWDRHETGVPLRSVAPLGVLLPQLQRSSDGTSPART
jgi:putative transposase